MKTILSISALALLAGTAQAQIGAAVSENAANDNFLSESIALDGGQAYDGDAMLTVWAPGDMFGITSRATAGGAGLPFAIADDSNGTFTPDTQGIIDATDNGRFFGVADTFNSDNGNAGGTAEWSFDVTGASNLSVNIDFAAMGDFESSNDTHNFMWSIDGSTPAPLFSSSIDEAGSQNYTMAGGAVVSLDDPMQINGTTLDNNFQTLSAAIGATGSTLTISYAGGGDGGSEAFAFRNLQVVPTPGTIALAGLAGLAGIRRRR